MTTLDDGEGSNHLHGPARVPEAAKRSASRRVGRKLTAVLPAMTMQGLCASGTTHAASDRLKAAGVAECIWPFISGYGDRL